MFLNEVSFSTYVALFFMMISWKVIRSAFNTEAACFNPVSIFFLVWIINLILYDMDGYFGYFYLRLDTLADSWLTLSFLLFFLGSCFPIIFFSKKKIVSFPRILNVNYQLLWKISIFLLLFFSFSVIWKYVLIYKKYGGVVCAFTEIRNADNGHVKFPFFLYFFTLPAYLLVINLGMLTILLRSRFAFLLGMLTLFLSFLDASSVGMRGEFLNFSLLFISSMIASLVVSGGRIGFRHYLFLFTMMFFMFFILAFSLYIRSLNNSCQTPEAVVTSVPNEKTVLFTTNQSIPVTSLSFPVNHDSLRNEKINEVIKTKRQEYQKKLKDGSVTLREAFFKHGFLYIVGTVPAYSYFLSHPWPTHYVGMWTFYGVYHLFHMVSEVFGYSIFNHLITETYYAPIIHSPYNSSNYLVYVFSDFGYVGLLIFPFCLGLIASYLFIRVIQYKKMVDVQFLSVLLLGLILSVRGVLTNGIFLWILILLIFFQRLYMIVMTRITQDKRAQSITYSKK